MGILFGSIDLVECTLVFMCSLGKSAFNCSGVSNNIQCRISLLLGVLESLVLPFFEEFLWIFGFLAKIFLFIFRIK